MSGTLRRGVHTGAVTYRHVDIGAGETLIAMAANSDGYGNGPALGSPVTLGFRPENMLVLARPA